LVEHHLAKVRVAGSSPVFRSVGAPESVTGLMNKNTGGALRAAAKQVLSIEGDPDNVDVTQIKDVESLLGRWANLRKQDFKPDSLETYAPPASQSPTAD
jgi:hypothetical protein